MTEFHPEITCISGWFVENPILLIEDVNNSRWLGFENRKSNPAGCKSAEEMTVREKCNVSGEYTEAFD